MSDAQVISLPNRAPSKPTACVHERLRHSCGVMPRSDSTIVDRLEELEARPVAAEARMQEQEEEKTY